MNTKPTNQPEILLVDDTPEHIESSVAILRQNGFKIRIAKKGSTALKLLEKHKPDLILLDVYMPHMDGFEVCRAIKDNLSLCTIPIIFLTSSNDEESIKKGFESGAQDYVIKPFNISELLARANTHIQLKRQTEFLKAANSELESFCYTVSHDLKAPLLSIKKLLDYLEGDYNDKIDENGIELIGNIREKSEEVINIVDHLLQFSKMCEMEIKKTKMSLKDLFKDVYDELIIQEFLRQIEFIIGELPIINGDPIMIKLLVLNILSNALKYTRKKDFARIKVASTETDTEYIISISDNGVGFNMEYSSRLFGVFQRLHSQNEFEGSGIGLAICQKILKRHNGEAWITGEDNKGATLYFSFPKNKLL